MSTRFERLFDGLKRTLETEGEYFSKLIDHAPEKGRLNESHLKKVLSAYLPKKFALSTGFAVSNNSFAAGEDGPQLDIIIYDALNNTPLYQSEAFGIFPLEMLYGYVEVKTQLTTRTLQTAFEANSKVRSLQVDKGYAHFKADRHLAPRFYLFAYKSQIPATHLVGAVNDAYKKIGTAHCHGLYVLEHNMLICRQALGSPDKIGLEVWDQLAFPIFLAKISEQAEGMIPRGPDKQPVSFAMPRADMRRYFPSPKVIGP